jgi:hypothetical protein
MTAEADLVTDLALELMPDFEPGPLLVSAPTAEALGSEMAVGDLLSEVLFGEVVEISDLLPVVPEPVQGQSDDRVSTGGDLIDLPRCVFHANRNLGVLVRRQRQGAYCFVIRGRGPDSRTAMVTAGRR